MIGAVRSGHAERPDIGSPRSVAPSHAALGPAMTRSRRSTLRALAALTAVLAALACAPEARAAEAGIHLHALWGDVSDAQRRYQLDMTAWSGARWVRVDVGWSTLQQSSRHVYEAWYLAKIDRLVLEANARGLKLLLVLVNSPCWASSAPETLKQGCRGAWWARNVAVYPPSDPSDYSRALAFLAARYGSKVAAWQVWNEPNLKFYFKAKNQAGDYARLVQRSYPAVKNASPSSQVVAGALALSDWEFTQQLYRYGIKGSFDAFSVHPYSDDKGPLDPRSYIDEKYSFVRGVPKIREVMLAYGDPRPIWLTEYGWGTSIARDLEARFNGVSEQTQARYVREAADLVKAWGYVPVLVYYTLTDLGTDPMNRWHNTGLRRYDGSAKPSWRAHKESWLR
jgi:polysaccharide biosynthesis protein PslG